MSNTMKIFEAIANVSKNSEDLNKLLDLENFEEIYELLKSHGYEGTLDMLKEGVEEFVKDGTSCLNEAELASVSGGGVKENLTKATSLGMASLLVLGASPTGSKASAYTPENGGFNVSVKTTGPVNLNNQQGPKKIPFVPLVKGHNFVKAAGIVAAVMGAGALGAVTGYEVRDKFSKPEEEPKEEKQVQTDEEFIKMHLGVERFDSNAKSKEAKIANCIKNISRILDNKLLSDCVYPGYKLSVSVRDRGIFDYLYQVVLGYVCGNSTEYRFVEYRPGQSLANLITDLNFSSEFKANPKKAQKARECIGHLINYAETVLNVDARTISTLKEAMDTLPKFVSNNTLYSCNELFSFNSVERLEVASKLYAELKNKGVSAGAMKNLKFKFYGYEDEYTLEDFFIQDKMSNDRKITVIYNGSNYDFNIKWQNDVCVVTER